MQLSIRLGDLFPKATLVEINANAMLSKYFGESGKLIESTFDQVETIAQDRSKLVVVVIDEVETIASSRQRVSSSGECNDGLRVSIQHIALQDSTDMPCQRRPRTSSLRRSTGFAVSPTYLSAAQAIS
jgi:SpoVK/Ycf46/Vps4 family AAA+-type ATPase